MAAYGPASANSQNVNFAFDLALATARDLWSLAQDVRSLQFQRVGAAVGARTDWSGPKRDDFDAKMTQEGTDATTVADSLIALACTFAQAWAEARGQQDRINFARYVQHEIEDDNWAEDTVEHFTGENDYGPPPENPEPPEGPDFDPTRQPIHPEYENR